jgi:OmcA/MtrC family decaheme c-type cytochrome
MKARIWIVMLTAILLALAGCAERQGGTGSSGSTGDTGSTGEPGAPGGISVYQTTLSFQVVSASVPTSDYKPVVRFRLLDQDGQSYSKLTIGSATSSHLRVTIAKLTPGSTNSPSAYFTDYLNSTQTKNSSSNGYWPSTPSVGSRCSVQSSQEGTSSFPAGTLTYDPGTAIYTYTFNKAINAITAPTPDCSAATNFAVTYDGSATHRIGMELRGITDESGANLGSDVAYDFVPNGGTPVSRAIVSTSTCNGACHGKLALHGDGRFTVDYCVVCHNPSMRDPNGGDVYDETKGNPLDLKVLVHRLHYGSQLPSVVDGAKDYTIWGYGDNASVFSHGTLPVMTGSRSTSTDPLYMRTTTATGGSFFPDCTKCHKDPTPSTPQADNWKTTPTIETCTSCHNNVYFTASAPANKLDAFPMVQHTGGLYADSTFCMVCHAETSFLAPIDVAHAYPVNVRTQSARWAFNVTGVTYDPTSGALAVTYRVDDGATQGVQYNTMPEVTSGGSMNVKVGWPAYEYANDGQIGTTAPASVISSSVTTNTTAGPCPSATTCLYTKTLTLPKATVNSYGNPASIGVIMDGRLTGLVSAGITGQSYGSTSYRRVTPKSSVAYFDLDTSAIVPTAGVALDPSKSANKNKVRRTVVDIGKCQNCHTTLSLHGNNRTDNPQVCVACHNPSNTDISNRKSGGVDGKREQSVDFKYMIHAIHAGAKKSPDPADTTAYSGFREKGLLIGTGGDFSAVSFPNQLNNCETCHNSGTYMPPLSTAVQGESVETLPAAGSDFEANPQSIDRSTGLVAGTGVFTATGQFDAGVVGPLNGSVPMRVSSAPPELSTSTDYYMCDINGSAGSYTFKLSTAPGGGCAGTVVTYAAAGTGNISIRPRDLGVNNADDLRTSPTATACSGCHDSALSKVHMEITGGAVLDLLNGALTDAQLAAAQTTYGPGFEQCELCHGAGRIADVKVVHKVP